MQVELRQALWGEIWPECDALAAAHFEEVDGGIEPRRPYKIDARLMQLCEDCGSLKIVAVWVDEALAGYLTWNVTPDVESAGLLVAQQGAWYVRPGLEALGLGHSLMTESIAMLRELGVHVLFPHHRLQGRGKALGRFFRRLGATEIQHTYELWIGD